MGTEEPKDPFKGVDWKAVGGEMQQNPSGKPVIKKRLPKKIRQIPDYYFLPRMSWPSAIGFYGACIAGGVGAGMLLEIWINKKVKEDGGIIWEFDK
ncbi:DNA-directed RNA polymerase subunit beta like [Quillaja saponaria]|uniref:DNA-directed RNA polymerase subunit beta like n=1 Tax=Quillaja saponaria TaxID=32244 RepID=A0AAD7QAR8_QUISA|nr:DNA-directed RNA polymerase subunit beta like [Quillaja saponaria]